MEGKYVTPYEKMKMVFYGLPFDVKSIKIDNEKIDLDTAEFNKTKTLFVDKDFTQIQIIAKSEKNKEKEKDNEQQA